MVLSCEKTLVTVGEVVFARVYHLSQSQVNHLPHNPDKDTHPKRTYQGWQDFREIGGRC